MAAAFDKEKADLLWSQFQALCNSLAATHDVSVEFGKARFDASTFRVSSVKFAVVGDPTEPSEFRRKARRIGLPEDWWGKTFMAEHRGAMYEFRIRDINTRNRKYKVLMDFVDEDGSLRATVDWVKHWVARGER